MANLATNSTLPIVLYNTSTNLNSGVVFNTPAFTGAAAGDWIDTRGLGDILLEVAADQVSADLGFTVVESPDTSDSDFTVDRFTATIAADTPLRKRIVPRYRYMRISYTNGGVNQGSFSLFVTGTQGQRPPEHKIETHMDEFGDASWVFIKDSSEVDLSVVNSPTVNYDLVMGSTQYMEIERVLMRAGDNTKSEPNTFFGIAVKAGNNVSVESNWLSVAQLSFTINE
ncbi:MAG: hypothetical protein IIC12_04245 [Proteobacteria bacterium]|nr:hypothetical protein [Pseudomonadota bacterium]